MENEDCKNIMLEVHRNFEYKLCQKDETLCQRKRFNKNVTYFISIRRYFVCHKNPFEYLTSLQTFPFYPLMGEASKEGQNCSETRRKIIFLFEVCII